MNKRNLKFILSFLSVGSVIQQAEAFIVFDPSNYIQNVITARNSITALLNQAKEINNQVQSLQDQLKNSTSISNYQWNNIASLMQQIDQTTRQGQALSYSMSDLDTQFRQRYPNYNNEGAMDYRTAYQKWNVTTLDTLRQSLSAVGVNARDVSQEQQMMQQLKLHSQTAKGRMQVLQASTEIAAENVNQMQELKRVVMAQTNAESSYMAYQVSKDSYHDKSLQEVNDKVTTNFPRYQDNTQFGSIGNQS